MTRPDWCPEACFDKEKGFNPEAFGKHWTDTINPQLTAWAAEQVRRNALPQKPEDVKVELPKNFQLPTGVEFKLDISKPEFSKLQQIAVKRGFDAETVSELTGLYAETLIGDQMQINTARQAELEKLGTNATNRVTALMQFFTGLVGQEGATEIGKMMVTSGIIKALESAAAKYTTQGAASFTTAHRDVPQPQGRLSEEQYAKLSPAQKLDYARQFDQKQFYDPNKRTAA